MIYNTFTIDFINRLIHSLTNHDSKIFLSIYRKHIKHEKTFEMTVECQKVNFTNLFFILISSLKNKQINEVKLDEYYSQNASKYMTINTRDLLYSRQETIIENLIELYKKEFREISNIIVYQVYNYIDFHIEEKIKVEELSSHFGYSKNYLNQVFKQNTNISLKKYITIKKIEKAKYYLKNTKLKIVEISNKLNFYDVSHFVNKFKAETGYSPKQFRDKII